MANRNLDDLTIAYLLKKAGDAANTALNKAVAAINATIATIQTTLNNKVSKSGDTMTGELRINDNNFVIKNLTADITSSSISAQQNNWYRVYDKNGRTLANFDGTQETNGTSKARIYANNQGTGTAVSNALTLSVASDGTRSVSVTSATPWRNALGLGTSGAFPITIAQGGSSQTGTSTESTVANVITAASGFTISTAVYKQWGKVAQVYLIAKKTAAQTSEASMTVGTVVSGKIPPMTTGGVCTSTTISYTTINSSGTLAAYGTWAANAEKTIAFTYILP